MQKTLSNDPFDVNNDSDVVYGVWISFAEVYNEAIFDLLDPMLTKNRKRIPLKLAQDAEGNTFIRGVWCTTMEGLTLCDKYTYHALFCFRLENDSCFIG